MKRIKVGMTLLEKALYVNFWGRIEVCTPYLSSKQQLHVQPMATNAFAD